MSLSQVDKNEKQIQQLGQLDPLWQVVTGRKAYEKRIAALKSYVDLLIAVSISDLDKGQPYLARLLSWWGGRSFPKEWGNDLATLWREKAKSPTMQCLVARVVAECTPSQVMTLYLAGYCHPPVLVEFAKAIFMPSPYALSMKGVIAKPEHLKRFVDCWLECGDPNIRKVLEKHVPAFVLDMLKDMYNKLSPASDVHEDDFVPPF